MEIVWTLAGDETSWGEWAERMVENPASLETRTLIRAHAADHPAWAVDLGCGTGRAFKPLEEAGYRVIGIDPNPTGIQVCHRRVQSEALQAIPLQASAAGLPLRDDSISFIYAVGVLFHLSPPELENTLKEIRRILAPGGKALLHFLDINDWRISLAHPVPPETLPMHAYKAVVTCFCSPNIIGQWLKKAGLAVKSMDLECKKTDNGDQRSWLVLCTKA